MNEALHPVGTKMVQNHGRQYGGSETLQIEMPYGPQMLEIFPKELKSGF